MSLDYVVIKGETTPYASILTSGALDFVAQLAREFGERRDDLLRLRKLRQEKINAGELPDFLESTRNIREDPAWRTAQIPADLKDRRVEITGPMNGAFGADAKMVINGLNSGANCYMADAEDSLSPTWHNIALGQVNLKEAVAGTIRFEDQKKGKVYQLNDETSTLLFRGRGLHLDEKHVEVYGKVVPASLFDFGMFFYHNAKALLEKGSGPYVYIPKMESHLEARLFSDVFTFSQERLGLPKDAIKATFLLETLPAAFEMQEMQYELKDFLVGVNFGRWDYIFSFIKTFAEHPEFSLPDRSQLGMDRRFLRANSDQIIANCYRRGTQPMGGMAAQIPIKGDEEANNAALAKVTADKVREWNQGYVGTWVAHPGLVDLALNEFSEVRQPGSFMPPEYTPVKQADLLAIPEGDRTYEGLKHDMKVGIQYTAAWLAGNGCVAIYNVMEDAATAQISHAGVWHRNHHSTRLDDGRVVTPELVLRAADEAMAEIKGESGTPKGDYDAGKTLFTGLCLEKKFPAFITTPAYEKL